MSGQAEILRRQQDAMPEELSRHSEAELTKLMRGACTPVGTYYDQAQLAFSREFVPDTAVELLEEWEQACQPYELADRPTAAADRQAALTAKFRDKGDMRREGYRLFAVGLGYTDAVVSDYDLALCTDECTVELFGPQWLFAFKVTASSLGAQKDTVLRSLLSRRVRTGCFVHCVFV